MDTEKDSSLLTIDHLWIQYNGVDVVHDASLHLAQRQILGVIGESGCGKSTLVNSILNMLGHHGKITNGSIRFKGRELVDLPTEEIRKYLGKSMNAVFQNPGTSLNPIRKIKYQFYDAILAHGKMSRREMDERIITLLKKLELSDGKQILNRYPVEFSGGMNQRIAIALAMILEPQLLIADEPTSALDVTVQCQVVRELLRLRENYGTAMIIVSHNMGLVSYMADSIAVMYAGHIVEYGTKEKISQNPLHPYTKALISAIPSLNGSLPRGLVGHRPDFGEKINGCPFAPRCSFCLERCHSVLPVMTMPEEEHWVMCHHRHSF